MDHIEHYRKDAELFDYFDREFVSPDEERRRQAIFHYCRVGLGERILEIGSGSGWFSIEMAQRGFDTTALDLSEKNLERIRKIEPGVKIATGDAYSLPFESERFDWIVANEVLEHLERPAEAIAEWKRFLKPGGRILVSTPYLEKIQYTLCIHCNRKTPLHAHLHSWTKEGLREVFSAGGFRQGNMVTFFNQYLSHFRINTLVRKLPFRLWFMLDRLVNRLTDKPRFVVVIAQNAVEEKG